MGMDWMKFFTKKWLYGSGRNMSPEKRGVWADLMALAAEAKLRDGSLRFDVGQPMPRDYIAAVLRIDRELLDICINCFSQDYNYEGDGKARIEVWEDGTINLTNFQKYQGVSDKVQSAKVAKAKNKRTRDSLIALTNALLGKMNEMNAKEYELNKKVRYIFRNDVGVVDTESGAVIMPIEKDESEEAKP